ncbi:DUF29 domain-containing protein [Azospirillum sp. RWY-5-1]|uniref:DUF29 domain-containing protein n=1 Tax=Azospirillum oleiclasticum TaxID=2735135 RepID=A0ABX2TBX1_9PROT|nr:DUF29 domain-containing protein [Azospirillum oleiclasticum]NYZ14207.1 DUF29 domain-containing protein [Azospirillum oleiclasticum]NYZ21691.1 DUF29 domain-containing protein [Azospirillum oleiclasticum]
MDRHPACDEDIYAWTQEQARLLREASAVRVNLPLDFAHLAEEIEGMGKSDRRSVQSALARVIEHLLKLEFSPAADPCGGWRKSVREQRAAALDALDDSPSLRGRIDLVTAWRRGRGFAVDGLNQNRVDERLLPDECPYDLDQPLDDDWWPANRHALD